MADETQDNPVGTRLPTLDDLLLICQHLNNQQARYVLIDGFAIFEHGLARLTEDIDLLVDDRPENVALVKKPWNACRTRPAAMSWIRMLRIMSWFG